MPPDFLSRFHVLYYCTLWTQFHLICINLKPFLSYLLTIEYMSLSSCSFTKKRCESHNFRILSLSICLVDDWPKYLPENSNTELLWQQTAWSLHNLESFSNISTCPIRVFHSYFLNMWGLRMPSTNEKCFLHVDLWKVALGLLDFGGVFCSLVFCFLIPKCISFKCMRFHT